MSKYIDELWDKYRVPYWDDFLCDMVDVIESKERFAEAITQAIEDTQKACTEKAQKYMSAQFNLEQVKIFDEYKYDIEYIQMTSIDPLCNAIRNATPEGEV